MHEYNYIKILKKKTRNWHMLTNVVSCYVQMYNITVVIHFVSMLFFSPTDMLPLIITEVVKRHLKQSATNANN